MNGTQKLARAVQRVVEDETGMRTRYTACLRIAVDWQRVPENRGKRKEEAAAAIFLAHRDQLLATAEYEPPKLPVLPSSPHRTEETK